MRQQINLSAQLVLKESELGILAVVNALSDTLKCNVFIDGLVENIPLDKPGTYSVQEVLDRAGELWKCTWGVEGPNLFFVREFSDKSQFPDVSLGELMEFSRAFASRLKAKYPFLARGDQKRGRFAIDYINRVVETLKPTDRRLVESSSGIVIGTLSAAKLEELVQAMYAMELDTCFDRWSMLSELCQRRESLECQVVTLNGIRLLDIGSTNIRGDLNQIGDAASVNALYRKLKAKFRTLGNYTEAGLLKTSADIQGHFITTAKIRNEPSFFRALAKLNDWRTLTGSNNRTTLESRRRGAKDEALSLLPTEYRRYLAVMPERVGLFQDPAKVGFTQQVDHLSQERKLLAGVLLKALNGRVRFTLKTASELEGYLVIRFLLNFVMEQTLATIVSLEKSPPVYLSDARNTTLSTQGNRLLLQHPGGSTLTVTIRRNFSPPM